MSGYCDLCDEELFEPSDGLTEIRGEWAHLCDDCQEKVEMKDGVEGRFDVDKCPTCGHVKGLYFTKYKPRGRPPGSHTDPKKRAERMGVQSLESVGVVFVASSSDGKDAKRGA